MVKRISHLITRTGDSGETGLADGRRVGKDSLEMDALGNIDELNSFIGLLIAESTLEEINKELTVIQNGLFDLGAELALAGKGKVSLMREKQVERIEKLISSANEDLPPLEEFILPGGTRFAAMFHLARSVCRRAERSVTALGRREKIPFLAIPYLNRLSDLFFVYARLANRLAGQQEVYWKK